MTHSADRNSWGSHDPGGECLFSWVPKEVAILLFFWLTSMDKISQAMKQVTTSIVGFTSGMTSPAFLEETMLCQDHCIGNVQDLMEALGGLESQESQAATR